MRETTIRLIVRWIHIICSIPIVGYIYSPFEVIPDYDLDLMTPGQTLAQTTARIFNALDPVLGAEVFDFAIVQGDTTTTMAGAMCASGALHILQRCCAIVRNVAAP